MNLKSAKPGSDSSSRFFEIDFIRGIAILMMIVFHILWDLRYFGFVGVNPYEGFWGVFQIITLSLFLFLAGMMIALGAQKKVNYALHFVKRGFIVGAAAGLVSLATFIFFPGEFVYFGVLHLIAFSIIISIPVARLKLPVLLAGIFFILAPLFFDLKSSAIDWLVWAGFSAPTPALDFVPLFPWFGVVLLGVFFGNVLFKKGKRAYDLPEFLKNKRFWVFERIGFLGRHSLLIYLIHQPIIFGLFLMTAIIF